MPLSRFAGLPLNILRGSRAKDKGNKMGNRVFIAIPPIISFFIPVIEKSSDIERTQ